MTKEAIAVLARLMIEHKIESGTSAHRAYRRATEAIRDFETLLQAQIAKRSGND